MALTDYQGASYDPAVLFALQQQVRQHLDPAGISGDAWNQAGQNIGFDYGQANQLFQQQFGHPMTVADQISLDMARQLYGQGVSDLSQLSAKPLESDPNQAGLYRPDGSPFVVHNGGFPMGTPDGLGQYFGNTYTGKGGTQYSVTPGVDGSLKFGTTGTSSSDFTKEDLMGLLAVAGVLGGGVFLGGQMAGGAAAGGGAASGGIDSALANMPAWATTGVDASSLFPSVAAAGSTGAADAAAATAAAADSAPASFGVVDTGTANSILGGSGSGLGSSGTGLTLGGGTTGLTASAGQGLSLAAPSVQGLSPSIAGDAIGGGLGSGFAGGTGSLLGPAALSGAYTMADGTVLPSLGGAGATGAAPGAGTGGAGAGTGASGLGSLGSLGQIGGLLAPLAGAALGSQGSGTSQTQQNQMDPRLTPYIYDSLFPQAKSLMESQMPQAQQAGAQMIGAGQGLLGRQIAGNGYGSVGANVAGNGYDALKANNPVAGNGYGQVQMPDVGSFMNPYYGNMANDIQRRTNETLANNNLAIQSNAVASGGLGGSRQGVAQGIAAAKAGDYLSGNLAQLGGNMYQSALSGALNKYGTDTNFYGQQRGQDISQYATDAGVYGQQRGQDITNAGQNQNFYGQQRNTDLAQAGIGQGLMTSGLSTQFAPLASASDIYKPYTGLNSSITTSMQQGGGLTGALGGALGAAQLAKNLGLFGGGSDSGVPPNPFYTGSTSGGWW
jgi:hypothetical protein